MGIGVFIQILHKKSLGEQRIVCIDAHEFDGVAAFGIEIRGLKGVGYEIDVVVAATRILVLEAREELPAIAAATDCCCYPEILDVHFCIRRKCLERPTERAGVVVQQYGKAAELDDDAVGLFIGGMPGRDGLLRSITERISDAHCVCTRHAVYPIPGSSQSHQCAVHNTDRADVGSICVNALRVG